MGYAARYLKSAGQDCIILRTAPVMSRVSMRRSTGAIRDFGAREAHWEGLILADTGLVSGEILVIDNVTYLVQSVNRDPASGELFWHAVKTNSLLLHQRAIRTLDANRNAVVTWQTINEDVPAFGEIVTVELRHRDPGILQATRYIFQLPKAVGMKILDRVVFNNEPYRVDAVNDIGMEGVVRIQVSEETRG